MIRDELLHEAAHEVTLAFVAMYNKEECHHEFSEKFEKRMKRIIWRADHFTAYKALKRIASIFIAILLSGSLVISLNSEVRAAFVDWVKDTFEGVYHYFFVGDEFDEDTNQTELSGRVDYVLSWLPDGYMLLDSFETPEGKTLIYISETGQMLHFMYVYGSVDNSAMMGSGEYEQRLVSAENFHAEVYIALNPSDSNCILWKNEDGTVIFNITGFLDEEELVKIAQSLQIEEKN